MSLIASTRIQKLLKDPFVHFLALGLVIYVLFVLVSEREGAKTIDVTAADIARLEGTWAQQYGRQPTEAERDSLIASHVEEEILYREALALGMEEGDMIIRRRLIQKYAFLLDNISDANPPSPEALAAFYESRKQTYRTPSRVTFRQIFFNEKTEDAEARARIALRSVNQDGVDPKGDPFITGSKVSLQDEEQIARNFGAGFARQVMTLEPGNWMGPYRSPYGWHLVYLNESQVGQLLPFEAVSERVLLDYRQTRQEEAKGKFIAELSADYKVKIADVNQDQGAQEAGEVE